MRVVLPEQMLALDAYLVATLDKQALVDVAALSSFIVEQSGPESVGRIIDAVCSDDVLAERCFRASESHPLGFDKYLLFSSDRYDLRLHIWWPESPRGREDIHNHRFSLVSGMIVGKMRVSTYEISEDEAGPTMQIFEEVRNPVSDEYRYEKGSRVSVRQANMFALEDTGGYYLHSTVLHRVDVQENKLAATLFLRIGDERKSTSVVVDASSPGPVSGVRGPLDAEETRKRLQSFRERIG
jgi:hypothetical protein